MQDDVLPRILLVINPVAGGKKKNRIVNRLREVANGYTFVEWDWAKTNTLEMLVNEAKKQPYKAIAALGGDGTLNFVANACIATNIPMIVLPAGSGNGFARHIGIPLNPVRAFSEALKGTTQKVDVGSVDGSYFLCTAGIGVDAVVGHAFANSAKRGFISYLQLSFKILRNYSLTAATLNLTSQQMPRNAILYTVANASQYGNNAYIAPMASITDGKLDVVVLHKASAFALLTNAFRLFNRTLPAAPFYEHFRVSELVISLPHAQPMHFDGEPGQANTEVRFRCHPGLLTLLIPQQAKV